MNTQPMPPLRSDFRLTAGILIVVALVTAFGMHYHDKSVMDVALGKQAAAEKLAGEWQGAATSCSNGVKQLVDDQRKAALKQRKREAAAIAAARRAGEREQATAAAIDQAKIPAGCGEAVQWGNQEAHDLGSW